MQSQFVHRVQHLQAEHEHHLVKTVSEYQLKIQQLQQELEESKRQVAISQRCQLQLEENLRQVFLRGVSTMNIEALTLFNSNHQHKSKREDDVDAVPMQQRSQEGDREGSKERVERSDSEYYTASSCTGDEKGMWTTAHEEGGDHRDDTAGGLNSEQASPEPLAKHSMTREDLDAKLKEMLAVSTSRLASSQNSNRVAEKLQSSSSATNNVSSNPTRQKPEIQLSSSSSTTSPPSVLRSAEMVQQHLGGIMPLPGAMSKPTPKPKPNTKSQVEMEYFRSTIAAGVGTASSSVRPRASSTTARARSPSRASSSSRFKS